MMIRTVLADDEVSARKKLHEMLREEPDIEIVGESGAPAETVELVRTAKPDLLFLDVRLPGRDGFEVIDDLASDKTVALPIVVFTTAYDINALRAFEIRAVDYLLKPFTSERLRSAIERAGQQLRTNRTHETTSQTNGHDARYAKRIVFKSRGRILFLPVSDIRWIGAEENYVRICTENETHLLREPIGRMEEKLDPQMFLRVHRSSIVNLQYVREVRTQNHGESVVVLLNGERLIMSRSYRSRINGWLTRS